VAQFGLARLTGGQEVAGSNPVAPIVIALFSMVCGGGRNLGNERLTVTWEVALKRPNDKNRETPQKIGVFRAERRCCFAGDVGVARHFSQYLHYISVVDVHCYTTFSIEFALHFLVGESIHHILRVAKPITRASAAGGVLDQDAAIQQILDITEGGVAGTLGELGVL
jgi:hypothetical protein